jgi:hypothetical protein
MKLILFLAKCAMKAEVGERNVDRLWQSYCIENGGSRSGSGRGISPQTGRPGVGIGPRVVNGPRNGEDDVSGTREKGERR